MIKFLLILVLCLIYACSHKQIDTNNKITPRVITEQTRYDTDDPAIWINPTDPGKSLIIGTDKSEDGALYVYTLDGKVDTQRTIFGLKRPNNVDVEYGLLYNDNNIDIAVTTERLSNKIRVFQLPEMTEIDQGGIDVFEGEQFRAPMGIALYKRPSDDQIYAIVGRKEGPTDSTYLWQYQLYDDGSGTVRAELIRKFGAWSGVKEIEAIAVDDALGYVYYSDEGVGVRKYWVDPEHENSGSELALFATDGFLEDQEGISIYHVNDGTGYIIVSDQSANQFKLYKREGENHNPHEHQLVKTVDLSTSNSDGSEVTNAALNDNFPAGLFVAMSDDRTFQLYSWPDIAGDDLSVAPNGQKTNRVSDK